jgi:hypothetical protein
VPGDGNFLSIGDTLKQLGQMRFGMKRADNGSRAPGTIECCGHN